jgi:hypothetical protein
LNRNYGYKWGADNVGSTFRKCEEDYRGEEAFSEPETKAVRDFMTSPNMNIKIAINFHTWGNLLIIPFNYDDQWNTEMINKPVYKMYEDLRDNGNLPNGMLFGNGKQTIKYTANGDATDWMAKQNDIMALSPELGIKSRATDKFLPDQKWVQPIIEQNYQWINYTIYKLSAQIETKIAKFTRNVCTEDCSEEYESYQIFTIELEAQNLGFSNAKNVQVSVKTDEMIQVTSIDGEVSENVTEFVLKLSELESLKSNTWTFVARISNENWKGLGNELIFDGSGSKALITLTNAKYPHFDSSQHNTRTLSKASILSSEENAIDEFALQSSNAPWYLLALFLSIIIIAAVVGF